MREHGARLLWRGRVKLICQPTDEGGRGANPMGAAGVVDDIDSERTAAMPLVTIDSCRAAAPSAKSKCEGDHRHHDGPGGLDARSLLGDLPRNVRPELGHPGEALPRPKRAGG